MLVDFAVQNVIYKYNLIITTFRNVVGRVSLSWIYLGTNLQEEI